MNILCAQCCTHVTLKNGSSPALPKREFLCLQDGRTIAEFCATEVEPMYRESDHIHIIALTAAADLGVRVIYLDRSALKVYRCPAVRLNPKSHP